MPCIFSSCVVEIRSEALAVCHQRLGRLLPMPFLVYTTAPNMLQRNAHGQRRSTNEY